MRFHVAGAIMVVWLLAPAAGRAGPPYQTDDPEPVAYQHWEVYVASQLRAAGQVTEGTAPHVEVNYGIVPDVQLHVIAPVAFARANHMTRFGFGDAELGVKVRFVQERDGVPMIGTFPLVEVPTGSATSGLGNGAAQVFLPLWLQKHWGSWQTYGGGGYGINRATGGKDWWYAGWQAQYAFPSVATLGVETYYATSHTQGGTRDLACNVGLVLDLTGHHHVLLSAGRDLLGPVQFQSYVAYQLTFGRHGGL